MALAKSDETENPAKSRVLSILGPGLITGASDDDPSGIATYSQVGALFGFSISWTMLFSYPLMAAYSRDQWQDRAHDWARNRG